MGFRKYSHSAWLSCSPMFLLRFHCLCSRMLNNKSKVTTTHLSEWKLDAAVHASSSVSTLSGTRLHPGPFRVLSSWCRVLSTWAERHASIFVTTTNVGTPSATAKPRCSLLVPAESNKSTGLEVKLHVSLLVVKQNHRTRGKTTCFLVVKQHHRARGKTTCFLACSQTTPRS